MTRVWKATEIALFSTFGLFSALGAILVLAGAARRIDSDVGRILELFWDHIITAKTVNWNSDLAGFFSLTMLFVVGVLLSITYIVRAIRAR